MAKLHKYQSDKGEQCRGVR